MHQPIVQYSIGVELLGDITTKIEDFFSVCKTFGYELSGLLEYVDRPNLRWSFREAIEQAPTKERGLITFRLHHPEGSAGGNIEWNAERLRTREQPFDRCGFVVRPGDRGFIDDLPRLLTEMAETVGAVYGTVAPVFMQYQRHRSMT